MASAKIGTVPVSAYQLPGRDLARGQEPPTGESGRIGRRGQDRQGGTRAGLPFGPFDPLSHRTFGACFINKPVPSLTAGALLTVSPSGFLVLVTIICRTH